jgi:hypothetical protein
MYYENKKNLCMARFLTFVDKHNKQYGSFNTHTSELRIYPNPANNLLTIKWSEELAYPVELRISDVSGRIVLNKTLHTNTGNNTIDVSSFADGIYTIQLRNNKNNWYEKFCKQR